jgi:hypothetical protein
MKRVYLMLMLALALTLGGCAHGKGGFLTSYVAAGFSEEQENLIANDLAEVLAGRFPPGRTSFHLNIADSKDALGQKLDNALRSRGFTLAAEASDKAPAVAYVLDQLDEGHCYARLTVDGVLTLARGYKINSDSLEIQALATDGGQ